MSLRPDPRRTVRRARERILEATGLDLPLRLWDGAELGPSDADYRIVLEHPWSLRAMLLPPNDLAAGEAYVYGDVDIEGDIIAALHDVAGARGSEVGLTDRLSALASLALLPRPPRRPRGRRARLTGRLHTVERDREAIRFHYDLGNAFFQLFLDEDLVYSAAVFDDPDEPLEVAQRRKLDVICRKLALQPGDRLLDIGCGWGSLVLHAARHHGVRAIGVTLSERQFELGRLRVREAGMEELVDIRLLDYRDVRGSFDAVASVGMFEHVGPDHLAEYFGHAFRLTAPGGRFLNQGITTGRRAVTRDLAGERHSFVAHYVFPDGGLVPTWTAVKHLEEAGFEVLDVTQLRVDYALTLRRWVNRLETNRDAAVQVASETDYRIWRAYMAGSVVGFESGDLGDVQILGLRSASDRTETARQPPGLTPSRAPGP